MLLDDEDFTHYGKWKWKFTAGYAARNAGLKAGTILMHRAIAGAAKGQCVIHKNGKKLDNRRKNLKIVASRKDVQSQVHRPDTICRFCKVTFPSISGHKFCSALCRFKNKVERCRRGANECWEWKWHRNKKGYGKVSTGKKCHQAHRVSYRVFRGKVRKDLLVCHTCDNPPCINPRHLFLGTNQDNVNDREQKGRGTRGKRINRKCK